MTIQFITAKLANEKGLVKCSSKVFGPWYNELGRECGRVDVDKDGNIITAQTHGINYRDLYLKSYYAPTQSELQKFIRESRGVHIEIHRNASGWYWSMCKSEGGTNLGWTGDGEVAKRDMLGDCEYSGMFTSFEKALESACQIQLYTDLQKFRHWSNYAETAIKRYQKRYE